MSVISTGQFVSLLTQSNLLAAEQLLAARRELATVDDEQLPGIAERIVERGWLTGWQARMLLAGRHAFFLGRYKLLDHLGEGGMGSVFKAEQTPLGRTVAIKLISKRRVKDAEAAARFHREIQAAAALSHPHIVAAYDADEVAGRHFLVMEYVAGRDLGAIVKGGKKLPIGEACEYVRQAALGLEHAHQRGMIHRDLKPSNLLLTRGNDGHPLVKILDMGLARLDVADGFEQTELTHTGQIVGTPDYISPEQARDSKSADARSDVYSLGCTLFRLVSGRVPFEGEGAMAKLMARMSDDPPALRSILPEAPAELEAVLLKMMARDPAERYQSAGEVVAALAPFAELPATPACIAETTPSARQVAAAVTYERPPTIDPGLNDFLQNLETAAAREEEAVSTDDLKQTLASGAGAPTAGWSAPVASEQPQASDPGRQQPAHAGRSLQMTRAGKKLQEEIAARNRTDRRRFVIVLSSVMLCIAAVIGVVAWNQTGETRLIVDWPLGEREGATIEVDAQLRKLTNKPRLEFPGRPGRRTLSVTRDGYEPIKIGWDLQRGETKVFRPQWKPTTATKRKDALADLQRQTDEVLRHLAPRDSRGAGPPDLENLVNDPNIVQLRDDLLAFHRRHSGTEESGRAAALMSRLPWPDDLLKREEIDPYELKIAGNGDPAKAPAELVAVLGDSRFTQWDGVHAVACDAQGGTIASSGRGLISLWNAETGQLGRQLAGHVSTAPVADLAFSRDGKTLYSAGHDLQVIAWNVASGEELRWFQGHEHKINCLALSPDETMLATADQDGVTRLWRIADGEQLRMLRGHRLPVVSVAFSPDGTTLATGSADATAKLWDVQSGRELHTFHGHAEGVTSIAFSPDGATLATAGDLRVILWNVQSREERYAFQPARSHVWDVKFHPDGSRLACATGDKTVNHKGGVSVWDVAGEKPRRQFRAPTHFVHSVDFSADGRRLVAGSWDGRVRVWDVADRRERFERRLAPGGGVLCLAISPDGRRLLTGGCDNTVRLWDLAGSNEPRVLAEHNNNVWCVAFSPDGRLAASGGGDRLIHVWDADSGAELLSFPGKHGTVYSIAFSPDGSRLLSGEEGGTMNLWDVTPPSITPAVREALRTIEAGEGYVRSVAWSLDGRRAASGTTGGALKVWTSSFGRRPMLDFSQPEERFTSIAFSPSRQLLVGGGSGIRFWDLETGKQRASIPEVGDVTCAAFRPDGQVLAFVGRGRGEVSFWPVGEEADDVPRDWLIDPSTAIINQVVFTPDGSHLLTANGNGTIYVLRLSEWKNP